MLLSPFSYAYVTPCLGEHFGLTGIALLALNVAVGRLRKHGSRAGKQAIAGVNFISIIARNHKKRNSVSDFGIPLLRSSNPVGLWFWQHCPKSFRSHDWSQRKARKCWARPWPGNCASTRGGGPGDRESLPDSGRGHSNVRRWVTGRSHPRDRKAGRKGAGRGICPHYRLYIWEPTSTSLSYPEGSFRQRC